MVFSDDLVEMARLLSSSEIEYFESKVAVLSGNSKDRDAITLKTTAQRLLRFISDYLSKRRVVVHIRDGDCIRSVELHGYSKDDALEILKQVSDIFISEADA